MPAITAAAAIVVLVWFRVFIVWFAVRVVLFAVSDS
jgi:hypothetical protein